MSVLNIMYVRGKALFRGNGELSVFIDGEFAGKLLDREELSAELADGRHEIVARCGHCKKIIELHMEGEDSFIISWDWVAGGLMACDGSPEFFATERMRNYWLYIALLTLVMIHIVNTCLQYFDYIPGEVFLTVELICLAVLPVILVSALVIRSRKIVRRSEVRK